MNIVYFFMTQPFPISQSYIVHRQTLIKGTHCDSYILVLYSKVAQLTHYIDLQVSNQPYNIQCPQHVQYRQPFSFG